MHGHFLANFELLIEWPKAEEAPTKYWFSTFPADIAFDQFVDTTVQPKNITHPTDAKLVNRAREKLVKLAKRLGVLHGRLNNIHDPLNS